MKILQVIPSYLPAWGYGGPIKSTHQLCRELVKRNIEVTVYTTNINQDKDLEVPLNESADIEGVKVWYFKVNCPRFWVFSYSLWKAIKKNLRFFDLIHIHSVYLFPTGCASYYAKKFNIPYIISPRGSLDPKMIKKKSFLKKRLYIQIIEKDNLENASSIHTTSELEKRQILSLGLKIKNIVTIPLGIDLSEFTDLLDRQRLRECYPVLKDKKVVLFLGRIHWKKGLDILVRAFGKIAKEREDVHLLIAGSDEAGYIKRVKRWIRGFNIDDKVTFTGMLLGKEKLAAFSGSDIFVLPSYSENFGLAAVEAMACGLPVVISNKVGIYKEVGENRAGIVVDTNVNSLYEGIKLLLNNSELKEEISANGRKLAREYYDINKIADMMIKAYEKILI